MCQLTTEQSLPPIAVFPYNTHQISISTSGVASKFLWSVTFALKLLVTFMSEQSNWKVNTNLQHVSCNHSTKVNASINEAYNCITVCKCTIISRCRHQPGQHWVPLWQVFYVCADSMGLCQNAWLASYLHRPKSTAERSKVTAICNRK